MHHIQPCLGGGCGETWSKGVVVKPQPSLSGYSSWASDPALPKQVCPWALLLPPLPLNADISNLSGLKIDLGIMVYKSPSKSLLHTLAALEAKISSFHNYMSNCIICSSNLRVPPSIASTPRKKSHIPSLRYAALY